MTGSWHVCGSVAAAVLLAGALSARAQDTGSPTRAGSSAPVATPPAAGEQSGRDIIVTAPKLPEDERVRALARKITPGISHSEPLARFADPVCFGVSGLPRDLALPFANRLVLDAQQARVPLGGEHCQPNVVVLFVDDGRAELTQLVKKHSWLFNDVESRSIRHLVREGGPVYAWNVSEIRSSDGNRVHSEQMFGEKPVLDVSLASITVLPTRRDVRRSVIVIERSAAIGRTLTQIADYAAMRALGMARPKGEVGGDTILTLFDPGVGSPPDQMTAFDRGYLKALYAGRGNQRSTVEIGQIARRIILDSEVGDGVRGADKAPASKQ